MNGQHNEGELYRRFLEGDGRRHPPFSKESYSAFLKWLVKEGASPANPPDPQMVIYKPPARVLEMPRSLSKGPDIIRVFRPAAASMGIYALMALLCFLFITVPPERHGDSLALNAEFEPPVSMEDREEHIAKPEPPLPDETQESQNVIPQEPPPPIPTEDPPPLEVIPFPTEEPPETTPPDTPPVSIVPAKIPTPIQQTPLATILNLPKGNLSFRFNPELKRQLRVENGGSEEAPLAVELALQWLAAHQDDSGAWKPGKLQNRCAQLRHPSCGGQAQYSDSFDEAATGLCVLAFLGDGHQPGDAGPYDSRLRKARLWLLSKQNPDGSFGPSQGAVAYSTSIVALALHELSSAGADPQAGAASQRALDYLVKSQEACGGWDYTPARRNRGDVSISGWCFLGLQSAVDKGQDGYLLPTLNTVKFIRDQINSKGTVRYDTSPVSKETLGCAATGLLLEQIHFVPARADLRKSLTKTLLSNLPNWEDTRDDSNSPYYWYVATMALLHQGGDAWAQWYPAVEKFLLQRQERSGEARGSFRPMQTGIGQSISKTGGRIVHTAFNTLTLETSWRYVPLRFLRKERIERVFPATQEGLETLVCDDRCERGWKLRAMGKLYGKTVGAPTLLAFERLLASPDDALRLEAARFLSKWAHAGARDVYLDYITKRPGDLRCLGAAQELSRNFGSDRGVSKAIWNLARLQEKDSFTLQLLGYLTRTRDSALSEEVAEWASSIHSGDVRDAAFKAARALAGKT